jgi:superfamily I DNA/RNA helicase
MATPRIVLITKADCHLCEQARDAVGRVTGALGLGWTEELVDNQPELRERYAEEIPVVLVDGVQRDFWKIDEVRLERLLQRAMAQ